MEKYLSLPEPFCFYKEILQGDHLHFGLWPDNNPQLAMEDAQQSMFEYLISFLPEPPARILDVGCGLGISANLLASKGYEVTAITPSSELIEYARKKYGDNGVDFKVLDYFNDDNSVFAEARYDVLLFQESTQYLHPLNKAIKKARYLLKDKGLIIIGDEVCYDPSIKSETCVHIEKDYIIALSENGFLIKKSENLSKNVKATCDFVIDGFTENFDKIIATYNNNQQHKDRLQFFLDGWKKQKKWYTEGKMGYGSFVAMKDNFFVRTYSEGDEIQILELFKRAFNIERSIDYWNWEYRRNPFGTFNISVAFSDKGVLVAHYAGYSVPFYSNFDDKPETFLSFQIGDTMSSPDVRHIGKGKTSLISRTAHYFYASYCKGKLPFFYGFNTGKMKKIGERFLQYKYIDSVPFRTKNIKESPIKSVPPIKKLLSRYKVNIVESVNKEWDEFFNRVCPSYKFLVKRDSQYLKWRYIDFPENGYMIFSIHKRRTLIGWSVFLKRDCRLIWGDALFDRKYPEAAAFLLNYVLSTPRCKGIERIEGWFSKNPKWWNNILDDAGFQVTVEPNELTPGFGIFTHTDILEKLQKYLYYTMGDSDLYL